MGRYTIKTQSLVENLLLAGMGTNRGVTKRLLGPPLRPDREDKTREGEG